MEIFITTWDSAFSNHEMQKYKLGNKLGDGSFGSVSKGINEQTGQIVAFELSF